MADDKFYMRKTLELAEVALEKGELPIAALIVLNDSIISSAHTSEKTLGRFLVHAESLALEKADQLKLTLAQRRKCKLYTTLEPCMMCMGASMSFFIGEVFYALESKGDGAVEMAANSGRNKEDLPGYQLPKIQGNLLREDSRVLFLKFLKAHSAGPVRKWVQTLVL
jgi:tRNA(adenine34) deaminase